jgi:hypothetical protein
LIPVRSIDINQIGAQIDNIGNIRRSATISVTGTKIRNIGGGDTLPSGGLKANNEIAIGKSCGGLVGSAQRDCSGCQQREEFGGFFH